MSGLCLRQFSFLNLLKPRGPSFDLLARLAMNGEQLAKVTNCEEPAAKRPCIEPDRVKRKKVAMLLAYSGQGYYGMQRNPGTKTIEEDLLSALLAAGHITDEAFAVAQTIQFQRAARTDKGVSAARQIVSLKLPEEANVESVNTFLPPSIRVLALRRTTKGFNCKSSCDARTYSYLMPSMALSAADPEPGYRADAESLAAFRRTLRLFQGTHNFHNFTSKKQPGDPSALRYIMNFECGEPFTIDPAELEPIDKDLIAKDLVATDLVAKDLIAKDVVAKDLVAKDLVAKDLVAKDLIAKDLVAKDLVAKDLVATDLVAKDLVAKDLVATDLVAKVDVEEPLSPVQGPLELVEVRVKGQSFMLHQIRKMVGLAVAVARGLADGETVSRAFRAERIDIPVAPGLGLVLEQVHYERYNQRYGADGIHQALDWTQLDDEVERFKRRYIHPAILIAETTHQPMRRWLLTLPLHTYGVRERHLHQRVEAEVQQVEAEVQQVEAGAAAAVGRTETTQCA